MLLSLLLSATLGLAAQSSGAAQCEALKPSSNPVTGPGVQYKVLMNDLGRPRGVVQDSEGNLLIVEQDGHGIRRVVLDGGKGLHVCVESQSQLVSEKTLNHGIALSGDGKTLFASSSTDVYAYPYDAVKGTVGTVRHIITGMNQTGHATRTLLVPRHNPNLLLVSRGSDGNIDEETTNIGSARSQIRIFDIGELLGGTYTVEYFTGSVLGWGLRNSVGVADDPTTGNIWSVENSIDNMTRDDKDVHNSNPGEELNFHGQPNDTASKFFSKNYGYPGCVAIWDPASVDDYPGGAKVGEQMRGDQLPADEYSDKHCQEETVAPYVTFGSHLAPLDLKFQDDGRAAFVSMHGSWNRQPPNGYRLSRVEFAKGFPTLPKDSAKAEVPLLWNSDNAKCPEECFRPVGLAVEGSKRVFMTSDASGELFVVTGAFKESGCAAGKMVKQG